MGGRNVPIARFADVTARPIRFLPGDRILVETNHSLEPDDKKRLIKSIKKWAGCDVEVLIYNVLEMRIRIEQPRQ